jgi:hypothetical protein
MQIFRLDIHRFRGIKSLTVRPRGHVLLVGEPRSGRSTIFEALRRVLSPDSTRSPLGDDLDFYMRETSEPITLEVVLGELGPALEQDFFDQLEVWDRETGKVVTEAPDPASVGEDTELVLRLCYRARWNEDTEQADHWVDFPKSSDPDEDHFVRVPRALRLVLPFVMAAPEGRPLGLSARSAFRGLVEQTKGNDLAEAVAGLLDSLEAAAAQFSSSEQVANALDSVLASVRPLLRVGGRDASELVSFLPDGGSVSGVLRSLGAAVELPGGPVLPVARHGSTTTALFASGELLAGSGLADTVVAVDDFGEDLDGAASAHLAATLRAKAGQAWLGTRRSAVAEAFPTEEIVRLVRPRANVARLHQGRAPRTRAERTASRHLALQLLPAMASTTVAVLEGPHDRNALAAVARRRFEEHDVPLPAAHRISLADAGAADGAGGASKVVKLARYARELGFRVVGVLDGDEAGDTAMADADAVTDAVIQLPPGFAIEKALLAGLDDDVIRNALTNLAAEFGANLPRMLASADGNDLVRLACDVIKSSGGLHAQFVDLLPAGSLPPLVAKLLDTIVAAGTGKQKGSVSL